MARHLPSLARSAHSWLWLHLLAPGDLDALTMASYGNSAGSGFGGEAHNLGGLWPWEERAFRAAFAGCRSLVVAGAGGGREMIALARMGFEVTGFDASDDLVAAGRDNLRTAQVDATVILTPPGRVAEGLATSDGLVIGRGLYHHISSRRRRIAFLAACRSLIEPGAPMVVSDVLTRNSRRGFTAFSLSTAVEPGDSVSDSFYHRFTRDELAGELAEAGFELADYRVTPAPGAARLAHLIARAKGQEVPSDDA